VFALKKKSNLQRSATLKYPGHFVYIINNNNNNNNVSLAGLNNKLTLSNIFGKIKTNNVYYYRILVVISLVIHGRLSS